MAKRGLDLLGGIRGRAQQLLTNNAALMNVSGKGMSLERRAKRFYDLPAKVEVAERIADEEKLRAVGHHNDMGDALRHARWSQRTAEAAGPIFAEAAGIAHEFDNQLDSWRAHGPPPYSRPGARVPTPGETWDESRMDLRNNAEGRAAAREGRAIDPRRLQVGPRTSPLTAIYRGPRASWTQTAPR